MFAPLTKSPANLLVRGPSHVLGLLTYWLVSVDCKTLENAKPSQYLWRARPQKNILSERQTITSPAVNKVFI